MMKTIKQIADEIGVSKTAIRNYMDDDFRAKYTAKDDKGVITITPDGCKLLSENIGKQSENGGSHVPESEFVTVPRSVWELIEAQIREKDEQLKAKDRQIEQLMSALQAEQALHAGTLQKQLPAPEENDTTGQEKKKGFWKIWKK